MPERLSTGPLPPAPFSSAPLTPAPVSPAPVSPSPLTIDQSYAYCRKLARVAARNFYYGFLLLPHAKRDALCALYAFMRQVDDIADSPGELSDKQRGLAQRRAEMDRALAGENDSNPIWPAFRHAIERYKIPQRYLHDLISGAEMDQSVAEYETFDRLHEYCYRVAGTVGLCCLYVFGFSDAHAPELAESLGIAFQLTNILRDLQRDLEMGRIYLPREDLVLFGCARADLAAAAPGPAFLQMMQFEADRAWQFYRDGWPLLDLVDPDSRGALWALARIYSGILEKIESRNYDVLSLPPARLTAAEKIWILARARLGLRNQTDAFRNRDRDRRGTGGTVLRRRAG
jgi:phytoene synthase